METKCEIMLDSNAFTNAATKDLWEVFARKIKQKDLRVVFNFDVLSEGFAGGDKPTTQHYVQDRFYYLATIAEHVQAPRFGIAKPMRAVFETELDGLTETTPLLPYTKTQELLNVFRDRNRLKEGHDTLRAKVLNDLKKDLFLEKDREIHDLIRADDLKLDKASIANMSQQTYDERVVAGDVWMTELFLRHMGSQLTPKELAVDRSRYRTILSYGIYCDLLHFANALNDDSGRASMDQNPDLSRILKNLVPKNGNWIDARIASSASYCKYLITDDAGMIEACQFIGQFVPTFPKIMKFDVFMVAD